MLRTLLVVLLICVLGTLFLSLPAVQTRLARYATESINKEYGTNINIDKLKFSLINWDTTLKGVYIEDYKKDTLFFIDNLNTSILSLRNLTKGKLEFGDILIKGLNFKLKTYEDAKDSNLEVFIAKLDDGKPREVGTPPFFFSSSTVEIEGSFFKLIDENIDHSERLVFRSLAINASDLTIVGPEIITDIKAMSFVSKQGLEVKKLTTAFKYSKKQMRFDSLSVQTPESKLAGNLVFNYDRKDFLDFLNKVNITAEFKESEVSFNEINSVYNGFGKNKKAAFSARISGVLNDLTATELFLQSDNTGIRGDFNFKNLFSKEKKFVLDADIRNISTNYYQLRSLLPEILGRKTLPPFVEKLGQFTIRGNTKITETSIDAEVNINTPIGNSYVDLALSNINNIEEVAYTGFVSLIDFDLGNFTAKEKFGKATLDFNVEGKGFVQETLNTEVIGEVYTADFNGYQYKNLKVSGVLKEQLFDGSVVSNDENVKFNFKGLADFSSERHNFNFIASVDYADLKKLNFIKDSVSIFKGNVNMDISGNSVDNIIGDIKFTETSFTNKNETYYFKDFKVSSVHENDSVRVVAINSPDIITGYVKGNFKVKELGKLVQNSLGSIYTNYKPYKITDGQRIAFNFKIYNKIIDVFFPEVAFDPNTFIKGDIVADEGDFKLTFKSPSIEAFGNKMENIDVKIDNKNPLFNTYVSVDNLSTSYYDVKNFSLINTTIKDTLFFRTEFEGGSEYDDIYHLNFYHTFDKNNNSVIGLKTSEVNLKGNTWVLNKEGNKKNKVIINKTLDSITIEEIVMNNDKEEQIRLRGKLADSTYKDIQLQFKIVSLEKITPVIDSLKLGGEVNGVLKVYQKNNVYYPSSSLDISGFSINDMKLGHLKIGIAGNKDLTNFIVNSQILDKGVEKLSIIGKVNTKKKIPEADLLVSFNKMDLDPFSPLGKGVIDNIRGEVNGSARVVGPIDNPDINGLLRLDKAGLAVPYLNVDYSFGSNSLVRLYKQTFDFESVRLTDVEVGTRATLDGTINHQYFRDWSLDLTVDTKGERFLILNKPYEEEILYYGTGFLNGTGNIFGSTKALTIEVNGETARGTSIKIPLSDVASIGDYSFINFIEKGDVEIKAGERKLEEYQGLEMAFNLDITSDAEVEIVVDQKTGSSLKGRGEGLILIEINTNGKFNMYGGYVVVEGEYHYKFGNILDKTFKVEPGGTINWQGEPLEAEIDMKAVYSLNANPAPLLDNSGYKRRIPTDVIIHIDGELERPEISFGIEFPGTNSIVKSELEYRLQDPTVEERNALFLLMQGTFVNDESGINQQAVTGNLSQTAFGLLNQIMGSGDDKLNLGLSYEQGILGPNAEIQTENKIGFTVSTKINDRVLINGRLGVPVGGGVSESVVAGDIEIQILLNDEGTLSAKIYNRENEIRAFLAERHGYTKGIGLSYEVDFSTFRELMIKIFKKKAKE
ncbi:MAG: translocation/assembly module TamB domain-containing protein [Cellulophaga sp.]